ncbi:MAG: hypothetical protein JSS11_06065 [Verrucomicrobia bacterium]|nr:hypothetical protein [Verrucomicrobiota bacterium]
MTARPRHPTLLLAALAALGACAGASCSKNIDTVAAAPAPAAWDWRSFPEASELLLAQLPATVQPARLDLIRAPAPGRLRLDPAAKPGAILAAGQVWAVLEPDEAAEETALLGRLEKQLAERRERYRHFELPLALIRLDRDIADTQESLALAQFAEKSPELFRGDPPVLDPRLKPAATAAQIAEQLRLLQERRTRTAAGEADTEPGDVQALATDLEQRKHTREARQQRLTLKAEFAGQLRLTEEFDGGVRRVNAGELVATLEDAATLEVRVAAALPLVHAVPPESLRAVIGLPGGGTGTAEFAAVNLELKGDTAVPVMRFRLALPAGGAQPRPPLGVELPVLLYTRLATPARIVAKLALVQRDPANALGDGWRAGLAKLFPGSELEAEGRQAVAVIPPR